MLHTIWQALWFFLPAAAANAAPIAAANLPRLRAYNAPIDFGARFRGRPLLGPHKTWRGIVTGCVVATLVLEIQVILYNHTQFIYQLAANIPYHSLPILLAGPAFGLGALLGDAVKSFFKRQLDIPSGNTWLPFDQLDYVIGGTAASLLFVRLSLSLYIWIFILWFLLHFLASWIGWKTGLKERPI